MLQLGLQLILMGGLAVMIYMVAKGASRIEDSSEEHPPLHAAFDHWTSSLPIEKIDAVINKFAEKLLRRVRVGVLKIDNVIGHWLGSVKKENGKNGNNGNGEPADLFRREGEGSEHK